MNGTGDLNGAITGLWKTAIWETWTWSSSRTQNKTTCTCFVIRRTNTSTERPATRVTQLWPAKKWDTFARRKYLVRAGKWLDGSHDRIVVVTFVFCSFVKGQSQHDVCKNNGTCYTNNGKVLCVCPPGYAGLLCELIIDTCDSSPCLNGGNCTSSLNNYTCDCTGLFFEGPNCENGK